MTVRATWLTPTGQTREDTRLAQSTLLTPVGTSSTDPTLRSRSGIVPGGFVLSQAGPMSCTIGTGRAVIQGHDNAQGAYTVAVTSPETLNFADGDPLHGRIDLVELAVLDKDFDLGGTGTHEAVVRVVQGTPSATPTLPASGPGSAIPLYSVRVPASTSAGTGGILWASATAPQHYATAALGGITPAGGAGFKGAYVGQYRDTNSQLQRWDGTDWIAYPRAVGGIASSEVTTGAYAGQYRDADGHLQRWDGNNWTYVEGRSSILLSAAQTTMQSVPTNVWTVLTLQTSDVDDARAWNGRDTYTVPRSGWWRVFAHVAWSSDAAPAPAPMGTRGARVVINGVGLARATWLSQPNSTAAITVGGQCLVRLTAGNTVQLAGYQTNKDPVRTLGGSGYATTLGAEWIRS
ncbi:hypothetical protein ACH41E_07680 [Streptomyces sp. NPDC020412]|uniref:hypothetical protein n=1 Tax=Streptomyces sp. NPDC020412 TaxID=3365073 RepID=UPI0037A7F8F6